MEQEKKLRKSKLKIKVLSMKVYLKIHVRDDIETIACCDEELLNQVIEKELAMDRRFPKLII